MARYRLQYDWSHTAALLAKLHNMLRGPNTPAKTPAYFHPDPPSHAAAQPTERVKPTELRGVIG
ncbi:MAG: hypothetical protein GX547_16240 [Phycisphaerae bacterium]|nr:hypothetical protein [Phycisphaerae bacterium]